MSPSHALRACFAACAVFVVLMASPLAPHATAATAHTDAFCADRLCTKEKPGHKSCWRFDARENVSKCFIKRAARHYKQSRDEALYIAHRESRYDYKQTNSSSGAAGLYQFMPTTWANTPYGRKSPYNPRWASLGAMWMWAHGYESHWAI
jgi:hypothetical protein